MFKRSKLSSKLVGAFLLVGILPFAIISIISLYSSSQALDKQAFQQLVGMREIKKAQITDYMKQLKNQLSIFSQDPLVKSALTQFGAAFESNGNKPGSPAWNIFAERYTSRLKEITKTFGWYDLFIINRQGHIIYTVARENDLGMSLAQGALAGSALGKAFARARENGYGAADFAPYAPSNNEPAGFMATKIPGEKGETQGYLALQIPLDQINAIMKARQGMGKTGESYLVGRDKLMRSDSYLDPKNHTVKASFANPAKGAVDTEATRLALAGQTGARIIIDYNGNPVLSAFSPVKAAGLDWVLLVEIDVAEALAAVESLKWLIAVIGALGLAAIVGLALLIARGISRPIDRVSRGLALGSQQVAAAAGQVAGASQSLAEGASEQAASLEETSSSLEEMSSMTKANAQNANQAREMVNQSSHNLSKVESHMRELAQSMGEISNASDETAKIIKSIDEIAFQTNLLALNAAVEAARAGDAGAGFAVVAEEVRNLATRAAEAARSTGQLIENTLVAVKRGDGVAKLTLEAFQSNLEMAGKIDSLISEVASASGEQSKGIEQLNDAVSAMDKVTQTNAASAEESASAAEEMNAQAETMTGFVGELMTLVSGGHGSGGGLLPRGQNQSRPASPRNGVGVLTRTGKEGSRDF